MAQGNPLSGLSDFSGPLLISLLTNRSPMRGGLAAALGLDGVEFANLRQHPGSERRLRRDMEVVEGAPHMRPAERQRHRAICAIQRQSLEPVVAVDLQYAAEASQMMSGPDIPAVLSVDIGGNRVGRPRPRPIINRVTPDPSGLGPAAARIEHRQGGIIGKPLRRRQRGAEHQLIQRRQPPAGAAHPVAQRRAVQRDALACQHLRLPIQRQTIAVLADQSGTPSRKRDGNPSCATRLSVAMPPSIGRSGAGATSTAPSQVRQA